MHATILRLNGVIFYDLFWNSVKEVVFLQPFYKTLSINNNKKVKETV